jgi:hypothetical protein
MSAVSPVSAESREPLDTEENEPIVALPHGELDAVPRLRCEGIEQRWLGGNSHQLHGAHPEPGDGLVAHDDQIRRRPRDENAAHLVSGRAEDRAPDADREGGEEHDEQESDERA